MLGEFETTKFFPIPSPDEIEKHPKRIILRLRVDEFVSCSPIEFDRAIMAYLDSAGEIIPYCS